MQITIDQLKETTLKALHAQGYNDTEAPILLDILMYAQLRGNNQGVVKLIGAGMPKSPKAGEIAIVHETKLSARLDGAQNHGMIVLNRAVDMAIDKAKAHDFGIVGTRNTNTSTGAIGYYAKRIADAGFIGLVFSGSGLWVAMHGAYEPLFGTNPLAFGIPSSGKPIVFDMATSAIARFGIIEAKTAGRAIPAGVAVDAEGNPTTDAAAALAGAILTFGGYKGAALSLIVEVLTGPLVGAAFTGFGDAASDWGNLAIAINPGLLVDTGAFYDDVARLTGRVKASKRLPGVDEIFIPGERGDQIMDEALASGSIAIDDALWAALNVAAGV
ncbi:MAG: Ldh family oxidoreductase [Chloroflexota bacterium]|nr:Ldh family oxidoreductase [Chloroflexota bacterium]